MTAPPDTPPIINLRLLTTKQLAEALGVPRWRVFELVAQGKGPPHFRVGKTLRFPETAVAEWIRSQCSTMHD